MLQDGFFQFVLPCLTIGLSAASKSDPLVDFALTAGPERADAKDGRDVETYDVSRPTTTLTTTTERKLMAKIDWHILPVLCVLYLLAFLDR